MSLPLVFSKTGALPQSPASLRAALLASVAATNPGYTANLPGSLIEDVSSTDVAAIALCDSAQIELINSMPPYGANAFLLSQIGVMLGIDIGAATNTAGFVVFTGTNGYIVPKGFIVTDGTYQYVLRDGGVIGSGGKSDPLYAIATIQGSWAVPPNTVTQLVTSVPTPFTLTVTNPLAFVPGLATGETEESYRARVLDGELAASQGMTRYLKTLLGNLPGAQSRLISVRQANGGWEVLCGGPDPYDVANAIFESLFDINNLKGSIINITGATKATNAVITTDLNHGLTNGQTGVVISGALGMTGINGTWGVTVVDEKTFFIAYNSTGAPTYTGGGILATNNRNVVVAISDPPDQYQITYVNPPEQDVTIGLVWNTNSANFVSSAAVAQLGAPALAAYVNALSVGVPINLFELQAVFQVAVSSVVDPQLLTRMVFTVAINGIVTAPNVGTGIIAGDPESYFLTNPNVITITQG